MNKPHKHAALIKAWADGAEIQVKDLTNYSDPCDCKWKDFSEFDYEIWYNKWEYRIKPKTIRYRVGLFLNSTTRYSPTIVVTKETEKYYNGLPHFVKWLGDWQEIEI